MIYFNPYDAEIFVHKLWRLKGFFQFDVVINVLVSSFTFEYLWVYTHDKYFKYFSAKTDFRRQILTSKIRPRA